MTARVPNTTLRLYPIPEAARWALFLEALLLAPYGVAFFTAVLIVASQLSGWLFLVATGLLLAVHVYLTTDLLLPRARKAEIMGFGLERRRDRIWYVGYSEDEQLSRNVAKPIDRLDIDRAGVRVCAPAGAPIRLDRLSTHAQGLFVQAYDAMRDGAHAEEVLALDPRITRRTGARLRFNDGGPRVNKRLQETAALLLSLPELWAAWQIVAAVKPYL